MEGCQNNLLIGRNNCDFLADFENLENLLFHSKFKLGTFQLPCVATGSVGKVIGRNQNDAMWDTVF